MHSRPGLMSSRGSYHNSWKCVLLSNGCLRAHRYGPCEAESLKGRMKRAVALLGEKEVQSIMEREGKIEVSGPPVASYMCCNR